MGGQYSEALFFQALQKLHVFLFKFRSRRTKDIHLEAGDVRVMHVDIVLNAAGEERRLGP